MIFNICTDLEKEFRLKSLLDGKEVNLLNLILKQEKRRKLQKIKNKIINL